MEKTVRNRLCDFLLGHKSHTLKPMLGVGFSGFRFHLVTFTSWPQTHAGRGFAVFVTNVTVLNENLYLKRKNLF